MGHFDPKCLDKIYNSRVNFNEMYPVGKDEPCLVFKLHSSVLKLSPVVCVPCARRIAKLSVMLTADDGCQISVRSFRFDYIWSSVVGPSL